MRHTATSARLVALCVITAIVAVGCSANPSTRWAQGRSALTTTQDTLGSLHDAGALDDRDIVQVDPFVQVGRTTLTRAWDYLPGGGSIFDSLMDAFDAAITEMQAAAARGELRRTPPDPVDSTPTE